MFFGGVAIALAATLFAGFSRTYYLRGTFGSPELSTLLSVRGFVFTAWMILLVVQTSPVAVIASQPLRLVVNATPAWQSFAHWLTNGFGA